MNINVAAIPGITLVQKSRIGSSVALPRQATLSLPEELVLGVRLNGLPHEIELVLKKVMPQAEVNQATGDMALENLEPKDMTVPSDEQENQTPADILPAVEEIGATLSQLDPEHDILPSPKLDEEGNLNLPSEKESIDASSKIVDELPVDVTSIAEHVALEPQEPSSTRAHDLVHDIIPLHKILEESEDKDLHRQQELSLKTPEPEDQAATSTHKESPGFKPQNIHQILYNHNSVLMGQNIEDIEFGEDYFVRHYDRSKPRKPLSGSAMKRRERTREAQKSTVGECCVCFSSLG